MVIDATWGKSFAADALFQVLAAHRELVANTKLLGTGVHRCITGLSSVLDADAGLLVMLDPSTNRRSKSARILDSFWHTASCENGRKIKQTLEQSGWRVPLDSSLLKRSEAFEILESGKANLGFMSSCASTILRGEIRRGNLRGVLLLAWAQRPRQIATMYQFAPALAEMWVDSLLVPHLWKYLLDRRQQDGHTTGPDAIHVEWESARCKTYEALISHLMHNARHSVLPLKDGVHILTSFLNGADTYSKEHAVRALQALDRAADRLGILVTKRWDLVLEDTPVRRAPEAVPLHAALKDTAQALASLMHPKLARVEMSAMNDLSVTVDWDRQILRTVLLAILQNALAAARAGTSIRLAGKTAGGEVTITTTYTTSRPQGDPALIAADSSKPADLPEETSFELYMTRLVAESRGGSLTCSSRTPRSRRNGEGKDSDLRHTTITLTIPLADICDH